MKVAPRTAKTQKLADPAGVLLELGHSLNAARTQMEVVRSILATADKLFGWDASAFDICGAEQKSFYRILAIETVNGKRVESSAKKASPLGAMGCSEMTRSGAKAVLRSQRASGRAASKKNGGSVSEMLVPVKSRAQILGVIFVQAQGAESYSRQDLRRLEGLAALCAGALKRIDAQGEITRLRAELGQSLGNLRKLNTDLEQRVQERTGQLEALNKELESFAYSISHDLRAPLRSIRGFGEVLLERYASQLDERGQEFLRRSCHSSLQMDNLINDLLKLSRVTRADLRKQPVNLSLLAETIAGQLKKEEPNRAVDFIITPGLHADCDEHLLQVVLENLLRNAWKFTGLQPRARIEFGRLDERPPVFFVRDNGVGFDMGYADKLFGVFQRLHSPSQFPGTGVGLATVQRIVHRHGGRAWAKAAVGQGAIFFFTLP